MKIRKKLRSNGGYALVYAVVAMTLMLAVVAGLTLTSVRGLRTQQAAVESLQKRYEAAGEMEEIFAEIAKCTFTSTVSKDEAMSGFKGKFDTISGTFSNFNDVTAESRFTVTVSSTTDDGAKVEATLLVNYKGTEKDDNTTGEKNYTVSVTSVSYKSYSYTEATT